MVILGFDIVAALTPDVSLLESAVRGVVMYFSILVLLRVVLRGRTSAVTVTDLLVLVLIADAASNAMTADYTSITNGVVLVASIIVSSLAVDWLAFRVPSIGRFVHADRKPLVVDGRLIRRTLQEELMTEQELMTQMRLNGVEELADVKAAYLEGNGQVSVIKREAGAGSQGAPGASAAPAAG